LLEICFVRRKENRLESKIPTTEYAEENFAVVKLQPLEGEEVRVNIPQSLSSLRQKLNQKAKQEPKFRFYALFDKITQTETLQAAWKCAKANKGAPGVDGLTFEAIEEMEGGVEKFLNDIQLEMRSGKYNPQVVLRTYIPKANGKLRPLGIPTIRDRVIQRATLLIIEPIFEADFLDCSHGFRPKRSAHDALEEIRCYLNLGYCAVYDADLKGYFDSIPHDKLMACVEKRIADGKVLKLIKQWLTAVVVEKDKNQPPKYNRPDKGTPQGGVISPLLANIYLHWFDKVFHGEDSPSKWAKAKLVRYADDFVVLARYMSRKIVNFIEDKIERWLRLEINREKTKTINLNKQGVTLNFLGYELRYYKDKFGNRNKTYLNMQPTRKALETERDKLGELTDAGNCFKPINIVIKEMNANLRGWSNYFKLGYPRKSFRTINFFSRKLLTKHLQRRSQRKFRPPANMSYYEYFKRQGLIYL
jgi:RNA-directed DNA polymerase